MRKTKTTEAALDMASDQLELAQDVRSLPAVSRQAQAPTVRTPTEILLDAIQRPGMDVQMLEKLMDLQLRWQGEEARKAYVAAMARFKADPPTILKDKRVGYTNNDGTTTGYTHATLAEVTTKIATGLAAVGISHSWDVQHEGNQIIVSCALTHEGGHSERVTMPPVSPDNSGKKNAIQQIGSAITYMQRYSLLTITGLAAKDQDDDGAATSAAVETVSEEQVANLQALLEDVGADKKAFLKYMKVSSLEEIPAKSYTATVKIIESKRGR